MTIRPGAGISDRLADGRVATVGPFARLCAAGGLAYCSYAMCRSPVVPLFARDLGAGPQIVGLVVAASTVTGIFVKLPAGALSDVLGRRALLLTGALVFALLPLAYVPVASLGALLLLRFVHGSATAIFGPVASATVSDLAPATRRGAWLGSYSAIQGTGQALGPVLAGVLLAANDYDAVFLASGAIGLVALAALAFRSQKDERRHARAWGQIWQGISEVAADARILSASLAQAGQFLLHGTLNAFLPLFAREQLGLSVADIGVVFGLQTAATLVARPTFGAWSDRIDRRFVIVAGIVTSAAAVVAVSLAAGSSALAGSAVLYGIGAGVTTAGTSAYVTDVARRARYGAAHGVFGTIYDIGDASGPIIAGIVAAAVGYEAMFRWMALVALTLGLAFTLLAFSYRQRHEADERQEH